MEGAKGYAISFVGILILILGLGPIYSSFGTSQLLSQKSLTLLGIVIVVVGVIIAGVDGGKKKKEVPIYHGKEIVGYRRI